MNPDLLGYGAIVERSRHRILRDVLDAIKRNGNGLPGGHRLFITFRTEGVDLPDWLRAKYPREMTIVLQHAFIILALTDESFTVGLVFSKIPVNLTIRFDQVVSVNDPWVDFGIAFAPPAADHAGLVIIHLDDFRRTP